MSKLIVIGSGYVGSTIAYTITFRNLINDVVLIDINEELAKGEALDINHGINAFGTARVRVGSYEDCAGSDMIVITAGVNRKVGQSREDLLATNQNIMETVLRNLQPFYTGSLVLMVSNPVDQLTTFAANFGFIEKNKICGTGCMLDTSRWISVMGQYFNIDIGRIMAYAVGKHGSGQRVLWDKVKIDGISVEEFCERKSIIWNEEVRKNLENKVTNMGAEIISRKGKTQFGISMVVAYVVECMKKEDYTLVSMGNLLYSDVCLSDLVYIGNYEVVEVTKS